MEGAAMALKRRQLASRRKSVGHSQESLAERLGVDRTTVVRWERAECEPQPWVRRGLADALNVSLDRLTELLGEVEEVATRQAERLSYVLKNPRSVDLASVAQLRQELAALVDEYDSRLSTSVLPNAGRLHGEVTFLRSYASGEGIRRALRSVEAESATFMGQLVWDAAQRRDCRTTTSFYDQAIVAAKQNGDLVSEAHARLRTSFVALYGDCEPDAGLTHAAEAVRLAHDGESRALTGLAMLHVSEANAMMGDRSACEQALVQAEVQLGRVQEADPARTLVTPEQLNRMAGSCYLSLGEPARAQALLHTVSSALHDRKKSQAIVLGNLALAQIRQRQIEGATAALHEAIDIVERTRGGGALNVLFTASRELRSWRERTDVQDVTDRMLALMAA
jgi:transcriptional regulator with XRE-family HTH domain